MPVREGFIKKQKVFHTLSFIFKFGDFHMKLNTLQAYCLLTTLQFVAILKFPQPCSTSLWKTPLNVQLVQCEYRHEARAKQICTVLRGRKYLLVSGPTFSLVNNTLVLVKFNNVVTKKPKDLSIFCTPVPPVELACFKMQKLLQIKGKSIYFFYTFMYKKHPYYTYVANH